MKNLFSLLSYKAFFLITYIWLLVSMIGVLFLLAAGFFRFIKKKRARFV